MFQIMEKTPNCCGFVSLVVMVVLILYPLSSWCEEETYKSLAEPACCVGEDAEMKRFDDIDYDSFVSLMGRRAAQPSGHRKIPMSRKRNVDHTLRNLLGRTIMLNNFLNGDVPPLPVTDTD
uniref:Uncharacterized protein n=1 Tax=Echeneis naucrates TaxID=173247 RepID=A0A665VW75_ECHNA